MPGSGAVKSGMFQHLRRIDQIEVLVASSWFLVSGFLFLVSCSLHEITF